MKRPPSSLLSQAQFQDEPAIPSLVSHSTDSADRPHSCAACGSLRQQVEWSDVRDCTVYRCLECDLGTAVPLSSVSYEKIYSDGYFTGGLVDGYSNYPLSELLLKREFRSTLQTIRRWAPPDGNLFEIGCAYGFFLEEASAFYRCSGIDLVEGAVASCRQRGLNVIRASANDALSAERDPIHVAVMLDVIEHLPRPQETLRLLQQKMAPGGTLCLTTGDWNSFLARAFGRHWRLMTPPQHIYFFSRKNLELILNQAGFDLVSWRHPWKLVPIGLILYQLARRLKLPHPIPAWLNRVGVPVNLFDAVQVIARRR